MIAKLVAGYIRVPLVTRLLVAFILGSVLGLLSWYGNSGSAVSYAQFLKTWISPFGNIFIQMLKMVVIPIVFFSLVQGASQLPMSKLGKVGARLMFLYLASSFLAAVVGIGFALLMNPGEGTHSQWFGMADVEHAKNIAVKSGHAGNGIMDILMNMFQNPFGALAEGEFLAIIVFAIMTGLSFSVLRDAKGEDPDKFKGLEVVDQLLEVFNAALYKLVNWIMEYAPVGVLALSVVNFGLYGPSIVGPYLKVVTGIILGIFFMIFAVYGFLVRFVAKKNPVEFFRCIKEPMLTAFVTRSSSAALPVSMDAAVNRLHVQKEVASFALPMGATINMDGVCVHLPMFAVLAANLFHLPLGPSELFVLTISTVLAAIGTGGVPGGSLMLLFIVLGSLGLSDENTAIVVSLALGVNPILDMFETMNNVTGDIMCTYLVGRDRSKEMSTASES